MSILYIRQTNSKIYKGCDNIYVDEETIQDTYYSPIVLSAVKYRIVIKKIDVTIVNSASGFACIWCMIILFFSLTKSHRSLRSFFEALLQFMIYFFIKYLVVFSLSSWDLLFDRTVLGFGVVFMLVYRT